MHESLLATRYAKALFDLSLEMNFLEEVRHDMGLLLEVFQGNRDFRLMLKSPVIRDDKKNAVMKLIFKDKIHELTGRFIRLIIKKHRERNMDEIARQFLIQYKEFKNITTVYLRTAVPVSDEIRQKFISIVEKHTGGKAELIVQVDEAIIGGFVLSYGDKQFDASLQKDISHLRHEFESNPYIREF
jgi:F-type H+-transporting ATPase subunit delta